MSDQSKIKDWQCVLSAVGKELLRDRKRRAALAMRHAHHWAALAMSEADGSYEKAWKVGMANSFFHKSHNLHKR